MPRLKAPAPVLPRPERSRVRFSAAFGFLVVHLAALGVFAVGLSWKGVLLCLGSYYLRMFAITAGFHRYFAHRTYRLSRVPQFLLAFMGQTAAQKGVLWWAAHHRHHHRYSDQPEDIHSPIQGGFWWSHMGWILSCEYEETDTARIPDFLKFPELRWLNEHQYLPTLLYALALALAFGPTGLFWGYFLSTVLLWHGTFSINSVMHLFGRRPYATGDQSRNSYLMALVTMGEGWHNNHHYYPGTAAQGFRWWQIDPTYYVLWLGEKLGFVRGLRRVPAHVREAARAARSRFDDAAKGLTDQIERLSRRWDEIRDVAWERAQDALADLEASRLKASERLDALQRDYAEAKARTAREAEQRLDELRAEVERARAQLAETLARLVEAAEPLAMQTASPA